MGKQNEMGEEMDEPKMGTQGMKKFQECRMDCSDTVCFQTAVVGSVSGVGRGTLLVEFVALVS